MRFLNNLYNKRWLCAGAVFTGILLFLFLSFSEISLARELENQYPKIPLPGISPSPLSLNDIFAAISKDTKSPAYNTFKDNPLSGLVFYLYTFSIVITGIVAFGVIIFTGVKFMSSGASPGMRKEAMDQLRAVILGILLLLGSWILFNTINPELTLLAEPGKSLQNWWRPTTEIGFGGYTVAGATRTGGDILAFELKVNPPHNYPNPIKPGETATLFWDAPEGSGDCAAYSTPDIKTWGQGGSETIGTINGQRISSNSTTAGFKLTIPKNQNEGTYDLHISCAGVRAEASAKLFVSSLSQEQIADIPRATVDLKLKKTGGLLLDNVTLLLEKRTGEELRYEHTDGEFHYNVTGDAIRDKTIDRCVLRHLNESFTIRKDFDRGIIPVGSTATLGTGLAIAWLFPGEYSFACFDKKTDIEIGNDIVKVTIFEEIGL